MAALFAFCAFSFLGVRAQVTTADVLGTVTDQTGAVIPGATITLRNLDTGVNARTTSNETGDYVFNLLPPGHYSVTVEAKGFKEIRYSSISLAAGDRAREDGKMQPGSTEETVEVSSVPPLLQTDSAAVSSVVTEQSVQDLPLNGRNFIDLVQIQPGVNQGPPGSVASGQAPDNREQDSTLSANGQSDQLNNEMIDGMDNNDRQQGFLDVRPSIDAIAEVKVDTNSFSAEYGRDAGAVVNVITKSGTNKYHGTAYEFFRNDIFDARDFFATVASIPEKPEHRQNQFGGSFGGPIKKDRTFFFGDVEDLRIVQGLPSGLLTVPSAQESNNSACPGYESGYYDFTDNGGTKLAASAADPVGKNYVALYPCPNTGGAGAIVNNYVSAPNETQYALTLDGRIDQHFTNGDALYGRYTYNNVPTYVPANFPTVKEAGLEIVPGGDSLETFAGPSTTRAHGVQFDYVHSLRPNLVMELKAGYSRIQVHSDPSNFGSNVSSALGVVNANTPASPDTTGLTPLVFDIDGYADVGDAYFEPIHNTNNVFPFMGSLIYTRGGHNIRVGGQFIRRELDYFHNAFGLGYVLFAGFSGNSMQDLLQGQAQGYIRQNNLIEWGMRGSEYAGYLQDDWRLTHNLTLNLGLRYDVYGAMREAHSSQMDNFYYPTLTMITGAEDPHVGIDTNYKNIEPRVGFAYSPGRDIVVRGGYGISSYPLAIQQEIEIPNPPYIYNDTCIPCSFWPVLPVPTPSSLTNLSGNLTYDAKNFNTLYVHQFNLMVQKSLGANVFTLGGVGELGRHLLFTPDAVNIPAPSGPYPNDATQGPPAPPARLTETALPNVNKIAGFLPWATNNYYAMQFVFARRFTNGLSFNANYTWAHGLGDAVAGSAGAATATGMIATDPRADYGNSGLDIRSRFATNWTYQLPFGRTTSGAKALATKGWEWDFIIFWQTGQPFGVTDSWSNPNGLAQINLPTISADRPNMVPGVSWKTSSSPGLNNWINPAAFTAQPAGTLGNEQNNPFYGPHTRRADMSVVKNFTLNERISAQFRAECYNISNTPNFEIPNGSISGWTEGPEHGPSNPISLVGLLPGDIPTTAGGLGSISSSVPNINPRQFQFALKLLF